MCVKLKKDRAVMVVFNQLVEQWPGLGGSWKEEKGGNQKLMSYKKHKYKYRHKYKYKTKMHENLNT